MAFWLLALTKLLAQRLEVELGFARFGEHLVLLLFDVVLS